VSAEHFFDFTQEDIDAEIVEENRDGGGFLSWFR
jgi:hypothetical protein